MFLVSFLSFLGVVAAIPDEQLISINPSSIIEASSYGTIVPRKPIMHQATTIDLEDQRTIDKKNVDNPRFYAHHRGMMWVCRCLVVAMIGALIFLIIDQFVIDINHLFLKDCCNIVGDIVMCDKILKNAVCKKTYNCPHGICPPFDQPAYE